MSETYRCPECGYTATVASVCKKCGIMMEHHCKPEDMETERFDGKYLWEFEKCKVCGRVVHT